MVCLGNICRSPMAEMIFRDMINKEHLNDKIIVDSAGTSNEEEGNQIYYLAQQKLKKENIPIGNHIARQLTTEDGEKFDYIIGMEDANIRSINRIIGVPSHAKVYKLLDFTNNPKDIDDPWYTRNFDIAYKEIAKGLTMFLDYLRGLL